MQSIIMQQWRFRPFILGTMLKHILSSNCTRVDASQMIMSLIILLSADHINILVKPQRYYFLCERRSVYTSYF